MSIKRFAVGLLAAGALLAAPAYGQLKDSGFYIGGGLGRSDAKIDNAGVTAAVQAFPGVTSAITTTDDTDTGWKVFAGYQINRNFAIEVGYANLGKFSTFTTTTPFGSVGGEVKVENNWFGDVVGMVPFGHGFYGLGRLGLLYSETKVSAFGGPPTVAVSSKEDDISWKAGLGIGYDFTNQFGIRGEWERYRVSEGSGGGKADVDLWSVSVRFRF